MRVGLYVSKVEDGCNVQVRLNLTTFLEGDLREDEEVAGFL